jgi:hypothetical protein
MTLPRAFVLISIVLFGGIAAAAYFQKQNKANPSVSRSIVALEEVPIEIDLSALKDVNLKTVSPQQTPALQTNEHFKDESPSDEEAQDIFQEEESSQDLPEFNQIEALFRKNSSLPIVETVSYKSRVPWKSGKAAWLVDYAAHHKTHLHFIARSINQCPDYTAKTIREGQSFNVLSQKKEFYFHLVIDVSKCKMWFYAILPKENKKICLKTYQVSLVRLDPQKKSGSLTPIGKYSLGSRVAVFQPKMMGTHKNKRTELIRVFGTRWLPFEKEIGGCSEPAKGFGIHGTPWYFDEEKGKLVDNISSLGKYESDGCIRMKTEDVEELFSIISVRETIVEIVQHFYQAKLPENDFII